MDGIRYDSPTNSGLNLRGADGRQFCLNQYKNNYSLVVTYGAYTSTPAVPLSIKRHWWQTVYVYAVAPAVAGLAIAGGAIYMGLRDTPQVIKSGGEEAKRAGRETSQLLDGSPLVVEALEEGGI